MSVTPWEQPVIPKLKKYTMETVLVKGVRLDGRKLDEYRPVEIIPGYIEYRAEGSAMVKLGSTVVLVGVKMDLVPPFPDTPNEAVLVVHAEFVPLASPSFEPGPPDENAIELARVVDRGLRESKVIALDNLVLEPGKTVWRIYVDIYVLNHDGNLSDAAILAAMAALMVTRVPAVEKTGEGTYKVVRGKYVGLLPVNKKIVGVTIAKIANKLLVDPSFEEEGVADAKLMIVIDEEGRVAGMQKTGMEGFTEEELIKAVSIAVTKSKQLLRVLEEKVVPYREELSRKLVAAEKTEQQIEVVPSREEVESAEETGGQVSEEAIEPQNEKPDMDH